MTVLLECLDVSVAYGGVHAVDTVSLRVEPGTLAGLIGPNGAGKTSLIDAISGFTPTVHGRVVFGGTDVTRAPPHRRARMGLARTFQSLELFDDLTVRDNLLAAAQSLRWWSILADLVHPSRASDAAGVVEHVLDVLGIAGLAEQTPAEISQGQRKLVGVARALARRPRLLLLDEPASGLDTSESQDLGARLRKLVAEGYTMLLVDHDMDLVLNVCDVVYVLDFGQIIAEGTPAQIRGNESVITAYLGAKANPAAGDER
jgi:ABC-type branched-subunit amino acid transport system ATPase component